MTRDPSSQYRITIDTTIKHSGVPMSTISWMGDFASIPVPVARAIEARVCDPSLYLISLTGGIDYTNRGTTARIIWLGAAAGIPPLIAQAIMDDCADANPRRAPASLAYDIAEAFRVKETT